MWVSNKIEEIHGKLQPKPVKNRNLKRNRNLSKINNRKKLELGIRGTSLNHTKITKTQKEF